MFAVRQLLSVGLRTTLPQLQENVRSLRILATPRSVSVPSMERNMLNTTGKASSSIKLPAVPDNTEEGNELKTKSTGGFNEKMEVTFTCAKCDTFNHTIVRKMAYEEGVCIHKCNNCNVHHLLADNLGYYKSKRPYFSLSMFCTPKQYRVLRNDESRRIKRGLRKSKWSRLVDEYRKIMNSIMFSN